MEIEIKLEVDNTEEVLRALKEQVDLGLEAIGAQAQSYAVRDCPVDTGLLRNSITFAVAGKGTNASSYHAKYGSNRNSKGKRISASSKKAGSVGYGSYSAGTVGNADEHAVYIGTNVEYAPYVEYDDKAQHSSGKAHFLRDAATTHSAKYKAIMKAALQGTSN